jgi:hypothetical protein
VLIDCESCKVRGAGCGECIITLLIEAPPVIRGLGDAEMHCVEMFALAGFEVEVLDQARSGTAQQRGSSAA